MTTTTEASEYAAGYAAAKDAISILAEQVSPEVMAQMARENITPVHIAQGVTLYRTGQSDAWADYQAQARLAARRGR
jgi:hypothetical protein